jgi:hypothetical protein
MINPNYSKYDHCQRITFVYDISRLTQRQLQSLKNYVEEVSEVCDNNTSIDTLSGYCVKMYDDILINEKDESVKFVVVIVFYGIMIPNLLERAYCFGACFHDLERYDHEKYNQLDFNQKFSDVEK